MAGSVWPGGGVDSAGGGPRPVPGGAGQRPLRTVDHRRQGMGAAPDLAVGPEAGRRQRQRAGQRDLRVGPGRRRAPADEGGHRRIQRATGPIAAAVQHPPGRSRARADAARAGQHRAGHPAHDRPVRTNAHALRRPARRRRCAEHGRRGPQLHLHPGQHPQRRADRPQHPEGAARCAGRRGRTLPVAGAAEHGGDDGGHAGHAGVRLPHPPAHGAGRHRKDPLHARPARRERSRRDSRSFSPT